MRGASTHHRCEHARRAASKLKFLLYLGLTENKLVHYRRFGTQEEAKMTISEYIEIF